MAKRHPTPAIQAATAAYEGWLARHLTLVPADLRRKHELMAQAPFAFLRATYYRWAEQRRVAGWRPPGDVEVLAVGDLHVENFGTWRDAEGRLVWGINDFDEATWLAPAHDLVRLAASARLAVQAAHLELPPHEIERALIAGYRDATGKGGAALVLDGDWPELHALATHRLRDPLPFWRRLESLPAWRGGLPRGAARALEALRPAATEAGRLAHRVAGLGSLGRQRFVALLRSAGGRAAREAKALAPSADAWADGRKSRAILYSEILERAVRDADPFVAVRRRWIVRRLAPDCSRIELTELPAERDEERLLYAMGWETANVHLGTAGRRKLLEAVPRHAAWLREAAEAMLETTLTDHRRWRRSPRPARS